MKNIVAIHQPNFIPWLGYFHKILNSQTFIILDDVQFPRGSWVNRVQLLISGAARWISVPVRHSGTDHMQSIKDAIIDNNLWKKKVCKSIYSDYKKSPFFSDTFNLLEDILYAEISSLAAFNLNAIYKIMKYISASTEHIVLASDYAVTSSSTQRLIELTQAVKGDTYMCGRGAREYQDDTMFEKYGIALRYQNFQHPVYPQISSREFVAGLSIFDALFNIGPIETKKLITGE